MNASSHVKKLLVHLRGILTLSWFFGPSIAFYDKWGLSFQSSLTAMSEKQMASKGTEGSAPAVPPDGAVSRELKKGRLPNG
jgi:hypothetical protein